MGNKTRNLKTQNLLCIPFMLCLIGCVHAMVTEDASLRAVIYNPSGEEVQLYQVLPLGPDVLLPKESFGLVTEKLGRFFIHKIVSRPKSGDTPEIVASWVKSPCYLASRDLDSFVEALAESHKDEFNEFKERLNYPTHLASIGDGNELNRVINTTTSWESLKGGLSLDKAVLFAMHPNVFYRLQWMLKLEDWRDLLMDMAMVLRWEGFLRSEQVKELFMLLANVRKFDLLREIVEAIPTMERMRMYESGILTHLVTFNHAKLVADMIADGTIPTPRLDVAPESVTLGALVHSQAGFVLKLLKEKILPGGVGVRLDSSILVTLIEKGYANDILELIQSGKMPGARFIEMLNAERVFEKLMFHGHTADIIKLLQDGKIPMKEFIEQGYFGSMLERIKLVDEINKMIVYPRLDVAPESVTLSALVAHSLALNILELIQSGKMPGARFVEMLNAERVFEALISHGHAADIIKLLQDGKIPMKEFMEQRYSGSILEVLVDKGYGSEVEGFRSAYYYRPELRGEGIDTAAEPLEGVIPLGVMIELRDDEGEQINPLNMMD